MITEYEEKIINKDKQIELLTLENKKFETSHQQ